MSKKDEKLAQYAEELKKFDSNPDLELLEKIVNLLWPSIHNKDAETVSCSDNEELERLKNSTVTEKLNLNPTDEDLKAVCEKLGSSNKKKYRALFYYFLVK